MSRFRISILTLQGKSLTFTVSKYNITDGDFVEFIDEKTGDHKKFHASRCEIDEVSKDG